MFGVESSLERACLNDEEDREVSRARESSERASRQILSIRARERGASHPLSTKEKRRERRVDVAC